MNQRLTPAAAGLLIIPPMLWAGNAVVGRMLASQVSPMTLNLLRWTLAALVLLPLARGVLRRDSALWTQWRWFAWISLFSIGGYNALLYSALQTTTPINVTLVGASVPVWMLLFGQQQDEGQPQPLQHAAASSGGFVAAGHQANFLTSPAPSRLLTQRPQRVGCAA